MTETVPTLPNYGTPLPRQKATAPAGIPVLANHKDQKPLVSLTKKLFNTKRMQMPKLKSKKVPDPFKKRKKARVI